MNDKLCKIDRCKKSDKIRKLQGKLIFILNKIKKMEKYLIIVDGEMETQLIQVDKSKNKKNGYSYNQISLQRQKLINKRQKKYMAQGNDCLSCINKLIKDKQFNFHNYLFACPVLVCPQFKFDKKNQQQAFHSNQNYFIQEQRYSTIIQQFLVKGINYKHCYVFLGLKQSQKKFVNITFKQMFRKKMKRIFSKQRIFERQEPEQKIEYTSYFVQGVVFNQQIMSMFHRSYHFILQNFIYPKQMIRNMDQIMSGISFDYIPVKQEEKKDNSQQFVIRIKFDFSNNNFDQLAYVGFERMFQKNKLYFHFYKMTDVKGKVVEQVKGKSIDFEENNEINSFYANICNYALKCLKKKKRKNKYKISQQLCGHYPQIKCLKNYQEINVPNIIQIDEQNRGDDQFMQKFGKLPKKMKKYEYVLIVNKQNSEFVNRLNQRMGKQSEYRKFVQIGQKILSKNPRSVYYLTSRINFDKLKNYKLIIQSDYSPHPLLLQPKVYVLIQNQNQKVKQQAKNIVSKHLPIIRENISWGQRKKHFAIKEQIDIDSLVFVCPNVKSAIMVFVLLQSGGIKACFDGERAIKHIQDFYTIK